VIDAVEQLARTASDNVEHVLEGTITSARPHVVSGAIAGKGRNLRARWRGLTAVRGVTSRSRHLRGAKATKHSMGGG